MFEENIWPAFKWFDLAKWSLQHIPVAKHSCKTNLWPRRANPLSGTKTMNQWLKLMVMNFIILSCTDGFDPWKGSSDPWKFFQGKRGNNYEGVQQWLFCLLSVLCFQKMEAKSGKQPKYLVFVELERTSHLMAHITAKHHANLQCISGSGAAAAVSTCQAASTCQ